MSEILRNRRGVFGVNARGGGTENRSKGWADYSRSERGRTKAANPGGWLAMSSQLARELGP